MPVATTSPVPAAASSTENTRFEYGRNHTSGAETTTAASTLAAPPNHLSCCRRSPVARR